MDNLKQTSNDKTYTEDSSFTFDELELMHKQSSIETNNAAAEKSITSLNVENFYKNKSIEVFTDKNQTTIFALNDRVLSELINNLGNSNTEKVPDSANYTS